MENLTYILCMLILGYLFFLQHGLNRKIDERVGSLHRKLDAISKHLGITIVEDAVPPEVVGLLQAGRKIEAIKVYRSATGAGLAEAKAKVGRIAADRGLSA
jgi:hypothetical protein